MNSASEKTERRRLLRVIAGALFGFALVQSITITPSIHGRVIDEQTGEPLAGATIAALWNLEMTTLVDSSLPGGPVKVAETATNREGEFAFAAAVLIHWPVTPFSLFTRSAEEMPRLIVAKQQYEVRTVGNDTFGIEGPAHGAGFLLLRRSSLEDSLVRMRPWSDDADPQVESRRSMALRWLEQAAAQCSRRWLCQEQPLQRSRDVLMHAGPPAVRHQN